MHRAQQRGVLWQVLEAVLDDDQDMQDMYLARRAEMAQIIAPDPDGPADHPSDDPANPSLANLPSISSSSIAEATLSQALQSVAATQELSSSLQESAQDTEGRSNGGASISRWRGQESDTLTQHPLGMAVPDQASPWPVLEWTACIVVGKHQLGWSRLLQAFNINCLQAE